MKKTFCLVLSLVLTVSTFLIGCEPIDDTASNPSVEIANPVSDFEYDENANGGITITKYIGTDTEVIIPEKIYDNNITVIGAQAFVHNTSLEYVKIPDTVTVIEQAAFWHLANLKEVHMPNQLRQICA